MANRDVLVRLRLEASPFIAATRAATAAAKDLHNELDKSNDRTAWLAQGILALAPAAVRMGAGAVPAISGLATQMTVAIAAAGTMALAFNGVGDALGALNDYQLDPSVANLEKMQLAMKKIGPDGEELVRTLDSLAPAFSVLADTARGEMFPGMIEGLESFMELAPRFNTIVGEIGAGIGQLAGEAGEGLSGAKFSEFFDYLENDAKPILVDLGRTLGNFFDGFTNMLVAFGPLSSDFSSGLLDMSRSFAAWSDGLESSQGFQDFVDYVKEAGPQTLDFLGSLVMALVGLAEALAPLGAISMTGLTIALDTIAELAATPLGPIVLGFLSLTAAWGRLNAIVAITGSGVMGKALAGTAGNLKALPAATAAAAGGFGVLARNTATAGAASEKMNAQNVKAKGSLTQFGAAAGPVAGQIALLGFAMTDLDDKAGIANTTMLALAGSMLGPVGLAGGALVGGFLDMQAAGDRATSTIAGLNAVAASGDVERLGSDIKKAKDELAQFKTDDMNAIADGIAGIFGKSSRADEKQAEIDKAEKAYRKLAIAKKIAGSVDASNDYYAALKAESDALVQNIALMRAKRDAASQGLNTELDYASALIAGRKAIKENGKNWDMNTQKGNENQRTVAAIADAWNQLNRTQGQSKKQAAIARDGLIKTAMQLGATRAEAELYAAELLDIPEKVKSKAEIDTSGAFASLKAVDMALDSYDGRTATSTINVNTVYTTRNVVKEQQAGFGAADGGTVPDSGKGYADRFLYMLADREEVVSNRRGQADKYRPALKAINADMPPSVIKGMLAAGGTVGGDDDTAAEKARDAAKEAATKAEEAADKAKEAAEEARRKAEEARRKAEEKRVRILDRQSIKALLASNLDDEAQQENLEVQDAQRRLKSAKKANRPESEILEARLELKTDRNARANAREERQQEAADAAWDKAVDAYEQQVEAYENQVKAHEDAVKAYEEEVKRQEEEAAKAAEEAAEHELKTNEAIWDGQQKAVNQLMAAADEQLNTAKATAAEWAAAIERTGAAATAMYRNNLFPTDTAEPERQSGLSVGPNAVARTPGAGWRDALQGDIRGLDARSGIISQLTGMGVSGTALEALLGQGSNDDIQGMIGRGEIAEFASLFAAREARQESVSGQAGQAAYGAEASSANAVVAGFEARIATLQTRLDEIAAARPISVYEAVSAEATAAEVSRQLALQGGA